ncbi:hypothetical protein T07_11082 [Trichinella nelsoni]|uniref:Uncharacterized protein n=1 Tax=Trichinella nelsoni TaxID=6336 RepID=A0A0V0SAW8_9BILA|nr:hypothetical protein T07_11082 [Trichinella nelsoni]
MIELAAFGTHGSSPVRTVAGIRPSRAGNERRTVRPLERQHHHSVLDQGRPRTVEALRGQQSARDPKTVLSG